MQTATADILFQVLAAFALARALGDLLARFGLPAVIGELLAGALLGPQLLGILEHGGFFEALAELGVILLLFQAGLETDTGDLLAVRGPAVRVGVLGVAFPFTLGYFSARLLGLTSIESLFMATAMVATSVGITIRVLRDLGLEHQRSTRIILAAAVLDDVLGLIVLALVKDLAASQPKLLELAILAGEATTFVAAALFLGPRAATRVSRLANRISTRLLFELSIVVMLALSLLAEHIGLAAIIGAFLAGLMLSELEGYAAVEHRFESLAVFFTPFFFILMGSHIDLHAFASGRLLGLTLALTVVALATKYLGGLLGTITEGWRTANEVGVGMVPRGEVGIVAIGIALTSGFLEEELYSAAVGMVVLTTFVAPFLIRIVYRSETADAVSGARANQSR